MTPEPRIVTSSGTLRPPSALRSRISIAAIYALLIGFTLSPLLLVSVPPLIDYPNHLAVMSVLAHTDQSAANYLPHWRLLPNLAMDFIVPPLARVMPLEDAGRVFIAAAMALPVLGTAAMQRALHGRAGLWPLASLLFVYNAVLFFGFLNYLFALGAALLAFSGWVASQNRPIPARIVAFAAIASLLFVLHLFALGLYGLLVAAYETQRFFAERNSAGRGRLLRHAALMLQFVPAALLWLASIPNGGPAPILYGSVVHKAVAAFAPTTFDLTPALFDAIVMLFGINFLAFALRAHSLKLAPEMRLPLAALIVAALIMPSWIGGGGLADYRIPVALPFVLVGSLRVETPGSIPVRAAALAALLLLATRVWAVAESWTEMGRSFGEFRTVARALPEGARILVVQSPMPEDLVSFEGVPSVLAQRSEFQFFHMAALTVIDRGAFIPYLFTGWSSIRASPRNAELARIVGRPIRQELLSALASPDTIGSRGLARNELGETPCCVDWPKKFDFVLWIDFGGPPQSRFGFLQPWATGSFFRIYRVASP